jgi:hypothetical protein
MEEIRLRSPFLTSLFKTESKILISPKSLSRYYGDPVTKDKTGWGWGGVWHAFKKQGIHTFLLMENLNERGQLERLGVVNGRMILKQIVKKQDEVMWTS